MSIKIAVDSNIIISLSKFINPKFDPDNVVHELLKQDHQVMANTYKGTPKKFLPPLLRDNYLGTLELGDDGSYSYQRLIDIYRLYSALKHGSIELCVTPLVFLETNKPSNKDFLDNYCTILTVSDVDAPEFYTLRNELATKYTESGAMEEILDGRRMKMQPSNDAYIMAEASLFGLDLITANERDFIHEDVFLKDYKRQNAILEINKEEDISFISNHNKSVFYPSPKNLATFIAKLKRHFRDKNFKVMYFAENPKIDENNQYYSI